MSLALVQEYPLIHEKELSRGRERPHPVRRPLPHRPSGRFQTWRSPVSRACWSHADEEVEDVCWEDEHDVDDGEDDVSDDAAYWCHSCGPDGEFGDVVDRMEQDIVCAFVAADCPLSDEGRMRGPFRSVSTQRGPPSSDANMARQHGVHVEKVVRSFRPKSELEIKKRREHVEQAKRNSTCRTCGRKGHWAGDQICPTFLLEIDQYLAAQRGRGAPTGAKMCRRRTGSTRRARIIRKG